MYRNDYEKWLAGGCSCETPSPCINGYDECSCDNILLEISNLHTDDRTLSAKIETKQDILEAGDGIKIENNVIEATYKPMDVDSELSLTSTNPIQNKVITEALNGKLDATAYTPVDLSSYALKSELPTVPTNVSAFNNDAGYLTEHQSLQNYYNKTEVNNQINNMFWCGTQAEYDALATKNNNTLYLIHS